MSLPYEKKNLSYARTLRKTLTPQEKRLWFDFLRIYPIRFQRQKMIDQFIADFYCYKANVVIEIDGAQHYSPEGKEKDFFRTEILEKYNLLVIRFTNGQVDTNFRGVCEFIDKIVKERIEGR